ncbi:unnamed protein product [Durusdinium trenchii]|uniref:Fe2OG dioxygenase domain-containing protein n=1 Tax=Durusdinium trenchii TaxID=1381693 RepID=A0ABP0MQM0_9DINO
MVGAFPRWKLLFLLFSFLVSGEKTIEPAVLVEQPDGTTKGWIQLCREVNALRSNLPSFVAKLGDLYEARQTISKKRRLLQRDHNHTSSLWQSLACEVASPGGPWRLKVDLEAPKEAPPAFRKHHRVVLVFPTSWPQSLPSIRFTGQLRSLYVKPPDEDKSDHVHEASSKLLARLQEAVGPITCMWRQTGGCNATGDREPEKDRLCGENVPLGNSGFCDCNGDGLMNGAEPGYSCESSPGSCETRCPQEVQKGRYDLHGLLSQLHRSLGGALHPSDQTAWQRTASTFEEDASTVVKYAAYGRKHEELFWANGLKLEDAIDPRIFKLIFKVFNGTRYSRAEAKKQLLASGLIKEIIPDLVFSFPVFTLEFCTLLMEEIRNFYGSKLPARRPNSMNNYGIILNEIGLEPMIFDLQDALIQPLASVLFPLEGSELESHHSFTIRFNVNIFGNYTGAPLVFCGINGEPDHRHFRTAYQHQLGYAIIHKGRHRHGAEDITGGERMNLVVWSYSYNYRHSKESIKVHQREAAKPDERCVSYTHDRDFGRYKAWPEGKKERFLGRGWCPPRGKEYVAWHWRIEKRERERASEGGREGGRERGSEGAVKRQAFSQ